MTRGMKVHVAQSRDCELFDRSIEPAYSSVEHDEVRGFEPEYIR